MNKPYRPWNETELYLLKETAGLLTARQLGERLHRPPKQVREKARAMGVKLRPAEVVPRHTRVWTDAEMTLVKHCVTHHLDSEDTSKILAQAGYTRSPGAIRRIWGQFKVPNVPIDK